MKESAEDIPGNNDDGAMMTVREVAQLLSVSVNTLRRWSDRGIVRAYRICPRGDRRFQREAIARFLAELRANGGDERRASFTQT